MTKLKTKIRSNIQALNFPYFEKSLAWFALVAFGYSLIIIGMIILKQYFLVIILILAAAVYFLLTNLKPRIQNVAVVKNGIKIGNRFYLFNRLRWFRLFLTPQGIRLELQPLARFAMPIGLHLDEINSKSLFRALAGNVPWNLKSVETIADRAMRWLRV